MRHPHLWELLAISLFLGLPLPSPLSAQESTQQPTPSTTTPEADQLRDLASRLLRDSAQFECSKVSCKVLVNDFFLADGKPCAYGIQLANQLSSQISSQRTDLQLIDRSDAHKLLEISTLPEKFLHEVGIARWTGEVFGADIVVVGSITKQNGAQIQLSARLVDVSTGQIGPLDETILQNSAADLTPLPRSPKPPSGGVHARGENLYRAGTDGLAPPSCFYMPNPPYTEEARVARFAGIVIVQAIISIDGRLRNMLVLKTPEMGITQSTLQTMRSWRCKPANHDGKPVPSIVTFQVNFRLK
jgi:Gram-negative bacterial TonB protein C-terminal